MIRPDNPTYRILDAWRGIACLMIVAYHSTISIRSIAPELATTIWPWMRFGYLGVPLFFVISGYCITATADPCRRHNQSCLLFLRRRARRLYPSYLIMIASLTLLLLICDAIGINLFYERKVRFYSPASLSLGQWLGNLTLTETWRPQVTGESGRLFLEVAWSLCYEAQFYGIMFLLLWTMRKRFFAGIIGVTAATLLTWILACLGHWSNRLQGTFIEWGWLQFSCGVAVYYVINHTNDSPQGRHIRRIAWGGLLSAFPICLILATRGGEVAGSFFINPWLSMCVCVAFAASLLLLRPMDRKLAALNSVRMLSSIGIFSYSMYLSHYPVCKLVAVLAYRGGAWTQTRTLLFTLPACVLASTAVAYAFYQLVEKRFSNLHAPKTSPAIDKYQPVGTEPLLGAIADGAIS
ncbi:MAG: acyltransferase [Phycisphaerales bacterium]|nr:acyltransferase [Phycisphaerales bacterium]